VTFCMALLLSFFLTVRATDRALVVSCNATLL
jgi:hypothetical protein